MARARRRGQPPVPESPDEADALMTSEQYRDKDCAKYYTGMVRGNDLERALLFAKPENIALLGEDTKVIFADGTFKTGMLFFC